VFQIFDKDNSGTISLQEFIDSVHQFSGQSSENKIKFLFKVYDLDGDGLIQREELQHVMKACMEENGMKFSETQIDDLTKAMFDDADPNNRGGLHSIQLQLLLLNSTSLFDFLFYLFANL
jgi:NADPH oxidase 5